jgi:hypothetical protein
LIVAGGDLRFVARSELRAAFSPPVFWRLKIAVDVPAQIGLLGKMKLKECAWVSGKP